jgi:N6-L-threonylcarbamoyladenine synthase
MLILGIETSCDETSVALLRAEEAGASSGAAPGRARFEIVSNLIASQIEAHQAFGGVVPEIASRAHLQALNPLLAQARASHGFGWDELGLIAVTAHPGLVGALLVGVSAAKALAFAHAVPLVAVNHVRGHVASLFLERPDLELPLLAVVVSGGHSDLILVREGGRGLEYERVGRTRDDAIGEAFDKVARALHLPLPGGPSLERLAREGDPLAFRFSTSNLEPSFDVSFSGLKTASAQAMHGTHGLKQQMRAARGEDLDPCRVRDVAASFQRVAVGQVRRAVERAVKHFQPRTLGLCGGVAANDALRGELSDAAQVLGAAFVVPEKILCTDNAAMIAAAGWQSFQAWAPEQRAFSFEHLEFEARSQAPLEEVRQSDQAAAGPR